MAYLSAKGFAEDGVIMRSGYTRGETGVVYLRQSHVCPRSRSPVAGRIRLTYDFRQNGVPFVNAVCNMAIQGGKVAAWGSSLVDLSGGTLVAISLSFIY